VPPVPQLLQQSPVVVLVEPETLTLTVEVDGPVTIVLVPPVFFLALFLPVLVLLETTVTIFELFD